MDSLIRNSKLVRQTIDFSGLQNGKIHPTDIDAVLEFDNEVLILMEVKRQGNDIPMGQKLVLERIVNSWHTKKSIAILVAHDHYNAETDIPLHQCKVINYFYDLKWYTIDERCLMEFLQSIGNKWNVNKLKFK